MEDVAQKEACKTPAHNGAFGRGTMHAAYWVVFAIRTSHRPKQKA